MKIYKIIYNSRKVKNNKFSVNAENRKEARKAFKNEYKKLGGNSSDILNVVSIEELKEGENLNDFFKK